MTDLNRDDYPDFQQKSRVNEIVRNTVRHIYIFPKFSVHCEMSDPSPCTHTCGQGFRFREVKTYANNGGKQCTDSGFEVCNEGKCPYLGIYLFSFSNIVTEVKL